MARVVQPGHCGHCGHCGLGQEFLLGELTPQGFCGSAYAVLARYARAMPYGAILPWQKDGIVRTHRPDPKGAVWELRLACDKDEALRQEPTW